MIARRIPFGVATTALLAAMAAGLMAAEPGSGAARLAVLLAGLMAGAILLGRVRRVTRSTPERFGLGKRRTDDPSVALASMRTIDTTLRMATATAFGVEFMLRPLVRDIAASRLERDHGIDLASDPDRARTAIGDHLWQVLHPAEPYREPGDPGIPFREIEAAVEDLERI